MAKKVQKMIEEIGKIASLRIEKWRVRGGEWRAGVEWYGEDDYLFICEYHTLAECLECILDHKSEWVEKVPKIKK